MMGNMLCNANQNYFDLCDAADTSVFELFQEGEKKNQFFKRVSLGFLVIIAIGQWREDRKAGKKTRTKQPWCTF